MHSFIRIVGFFWFVATLAGCHRSVGIEFDAGIDARVQDAFVQNDAAQHEDSSIQADSAPQQDAEIQQDSAIQADSQIQPDADTTPGTLTYSVNHLHQPPIYIPIWDGAENEMTEVTLKNGDKSVTISSLTFKKIGSADASGLEDPVILLNGVPFQHTYEWTSPENLAFNFSLNLSAMEEATLKLKVRPNWQLCLNVAFDVGADSDIVATTSDNQLPATVTEHANSMTPVPVFIYGFRFYLDAMTPMGNLSPGSNVVLVRYHIISAFDAVVSANKFYFWTSQQDGEMYFSDFAVWETYGGYVVSGPMTPFPCTGTECELSSGDQYNVSGNCVDNSYHLTADIQSPATTPLFVRVDTPSSEWEIIESASALEVPPEYLPDSLSSPTLLME